MLLGGAVGLPIPEDLPLVLSGVLAHQGSANIFILLPICYIGTILGDLFIYGVGRYLGIKLLKKRWIRNRIHPKKIRAAKLKLEQKGFLTILIARHLFYLRTVTFFTCGLVRMNFYKYCLYDGIAALISCMTLMLIGYKFAANYEAVSQYIKNWGIYTGGFIGSVLVLYFLYKKITYRRQAIK